MGGTRLPYLALGAGALLLALALALWAGVAEGLALLLGLGLLAAPAWFPARVTRGVAGVYVLALAFTALNVLVEDLDVGSGLAVAAALGVAGAAFLPPAVRRRVTFLVPSLVLLLFVTCVLMFQAPGNPFASEKQTTQQAQQAQQRRFKVRDTAVAYFGDYLHDLVFKGTMGPAVKVQGRNVEDLLRPALPVSMSLGLLALLLATLLGLVLGIRAGLRPGSVSDFSSMALGMVGISLPNFVIGAGFLLVLALGLGWFPVAGWGGYQHLVLPALTLALPYAAYIARLARNGTIEVMQQDFVRTARAKGLTEREVVLKHALKGILLPVVSFLGPAAAGVFTGSFVVETLFGVPGMGRWFVNGALNRDYAVVLGCAIIYCTLITVFNLLVDLAYAWLDPRVRNAA